MSLSKRPAWRSSLSFFDKHRDYLGRIARPWYSMVYARHACAAPDPHSPMKIITVSEMRRLEQESTVPLETLMQTAGENACAEILRFAENTLSPRHRQRFVVVVGKGNNGGDALVVAKCLKRQGLCVEVFSTCPLSAYSGTAASQAVDLF